MTIEPDTRQSRTDLAGTLRKLRKAAGLSGERLAARCAMSQSKISRIESGRILPSVVDVDRIVTSLEVPSEIATELVALARRANVEHTSWRAVAEIGLWRKQHELKAVAESAKAVRQFLPAMPSGLVQVPEYARHALSPKVGSDPARDVEKAVRARLDRQAVLDDEARRFVFLMTEQAVIWKIASRDVMARQCQHMAKLSELPNIEIQILPRSATIPDTAMNSFAIYDDRLVIAELFSGEVVLRDPRDVTYHLELFEFFQRHALTGPPATAFLLSARDDFM